MLDGKAHGVGRWVTDSNTIFEGQFKNEKAHRYLREICGDDAAYAVSFLKDNKFHGLSKRFRKDGTLVEYLSCLYENDEITRNLNEDEKNLDDTNLNYWKV